MTMSILNYFKPNLPNPRRHGGELLPAQVIESANREVEWSLEAKSKQSRQKYKYVSVFLCVYVFVLFLLAPVVGTVLVNEPILGDLQLYMEQLLHLAFS